MHAVGLVVLEPGFVEVQIVVVVIIILILLLLLKS